jgi:hypothetical protein
MMFDTTIHIIDLFLHRILTHLSKRGERKLAKKAEADRRVDAEALGYCLQVLGQEVPDLLCPGHQKKLEAGCGDRRDAVFNFH